MKPAKDQFGNTALVMAILSVMLLLTASCLKDAPETFPEIVEWNPRLAFPLGENSYGLNAVSGFDTTLLDLDTITGFPDWVDELEVKMQGTVEFSLASIQHNLDNINRVLFRINLYNGFPNEILAQAYFQDASMNNIDSIFFDGPLLVSPGIVQGSGETIQPTHARKDAIFDRARLQPLENATVLLFSATMLVKEEELDTTLIPYYPSYQFDVRIGAMLDLSLEF
jgi:hypothetical protein